MPCFLMTGKQETCIDAKSPPLRYGERRLMTFLLKFLEIFSRFTSWLLGWLLGRWWHLGSPSCWDMPGKELSESVRELHVPSGDVDMEIIFFHGLDFGERRDAQCRAWMSDDGRECWPEKWLPERFPGARILAVSYDASALRTNTRGRMDLKLIAENLVSELILCNDVAAGQGLHCPLVLVGHSIGGLVIKQLCGQAFDKMNACKSGSGDEDHHKRLDRFLRNLRGVFYYSTPHVGSRVANFTPWYKTRGRIMEIIDKDSPKAAELHMEFKAIRRKYKDAWTLAGVVESQETELPGFRGVVVEVSSARIDNDFGEHTTESEDHFTICRPRGRTTSAYLRLVNFLSVIQEHAKPVDIHSISSRQKFFVDLPSRVLEIERILETVPTLGLYGMGGVGKTTLARAVLEACHLKFEFSCWIPDLKELMKGERGPRLKGCMLEALRYRGRKVPEEDADWDILKGRKVLLIVDNVDSEDQLVEIPLQNWFGEESRVIVTSRDKGFCKRRLRMAWKVNFLTKDLSWELFLHHAFEKEEPPSHVINGNLQKVLKFCGGVPLAIEVIGRALHKETTEEIWEAAIQKLEEGEPADGNRDQRLLNSLRLSYDRLADEEQKMFFDSALLVRHEPISKALQIWKASWGLGVLISWRNLTFGCLVDVEDGRVWVHEALRMLARNIACPKHDGGLMRNWLMVVNPREVVELLRDTSQEPCKAEGLIYARWHNSRTPLSLDSERITDTRFPHLRLLTMVNVQLAGEVVHLSSRLVSLRWSHWTLTTVPIRLRHLTRLSCLDLTECKALESIPEDVDALTTLTRLELGGCRSLTCLPAALGNMTMLNWLDVQGCSTLSSLPQEIGNLTGLEYLEAKNSGLRVIPESFERLTNLETLSLRGSLVSKLPDSLGKLKKLKVIEAGGTPLVRLPSSVVSCQSLSILDLSHTLVSSLPESFGADLRNLGQLNLSHTPLARFPSSIISCPSLHYLDLSHTLVSSLPESFGALRELSSLILSHTRVEVLPESFTRLGELSLLQMDSTPLRRLPELFGNLQQLFQLVLADTRLEELPTSITELEKLEVLFLSGCEKLLYLPDDFDTLESLTDLHLTNQLAMSSNLPEGLISLGVGYGESLFDADDWAADEIAQDELEPGTPSASTSERTDSGGEASERPEREREGRLLSELATVAPHVNATNLTELRYLFATLEQLQVEGNANVTEIAQPFLHALSQMETLQHLSLENFLAVKRFPEDFGNFLPNSLHILSLHTWRSLEELPESVGRVTTLTELRLANLDNLARLPDWPQLKKIEVHHCKNLRSWPARGFGGHKVSVSINSLALLEDLVENHGHLPQLEVKFRVQREYCKRMEIALPSWRSLTLLHEGYRREGILEVMEALAQVYGGDSGEDQRHSTRLSLSPSPALSPPLFDLHVVGY